MSLLHRFFVLFLFLSPGLYAQGDMRFFGTATKDSKPLAGASVTVYQAGSKILDLTTGKNGKFKFTIDLGYDYKIAYSAPGCVDMYMEMSLKVPASKMGIYPDYVAEVPFFDAATPKLNTALFTKEPFIKVIFDGDKGFKDDPSWRFIDRVFQNTNEDQKKLLAQKEAEEKAKKDAEEKARQDEENRKLLAMKDEENRKHAEQEAARLRAEAEARAKAAQNAVAVKEPTTDENATSGNSMETEAIKLERDKQEKLAQEAKNRGIKSQYENNLLKLVAESEKRANIEKFTQMKREAESNSVVQTMRRDAERKGRSEYLNEQEKLRQKKTLENTQVKATEMKHLVEAAAANERNTKMSAASPVVKLSDYRYAPTPSVAVSVREDSFTKTKITVVSWSDGKHDVYQEVHYWWGATYFYKNNTSIAESTFYADIRKYKK